MIDEFEFGIIKCAMSIVFLVDTSASMAGQKIDDLNRFMTDAVRIVEETARKMEIRIPIRVIEFNSEAKWLFGDAEDGVEHIDWISLYANTCESTNTSAATDLARSIMNRRILWERIFRPIVVLVSDGLSTDPQKTMDTIESLKYSLSGSVNPKKDKVRRISVCVSGSNENELIAFSSTEVKTILSNWYIKNEDDLIRHNPLVLRTEDIELFRGLLETLISYPQPAPVWPEEVEEPVITVTGGDDDNDDWEE